MDVKEKKIRAVVAEDDYLVCEEISRMLRVAGHQVAGVAPDGAKAVDMVCSLCPDVVIMDIEMPRMGGLEACAQIQDRCPTPVVVLTAYESQSLVAEAGAKGVGAYLTKPADPVILDRAIIIAMARHADLMETRRLYQVLEEKHQALAQALEQIKTLEGIIPICAACKKIRDDDGYWEQMEAYIQSRSKVKFSHGMCPDCCDRLYGDKPWYIEMKMKKAQKKFGP